MDPAAIAGLCALLAQSPAQPPAPAGVSCPPAAVAAPTSLARLAARVALPADRDAIARVTFAEAGNQGDSGLAAVVYTILNRLADGRWGDSVDSVLNARNQFEPVMRVGGDWRRLAPVSLAQQARIDTILNLALDGRLPDLTHGARYFQNPAIVAARARVGEVSPGLVNFGGAAPTAVIGAHAFYTATGGGGGRGVAKRASEPGPPAIFVGENRADSAVAEATAQNTDPINAKGSSDGLFVSRDGRVSDEVVAIAR